MALRPRPKEPVCTVVSSTYSHSQFDSLDMHSRLSRDRLNDAPQYLFSQTRFLQKAFSVKDQEFEASMGCNEKMQGKLSRRDRAIVRSDSHHKFPGLAPVSALSVFAPTRCEAGSSISSTSLEGEEDYRHVAVAIDGCRGQAESKQDRDDFKTRSERNRRAPERRHSERRHSNGRSKQEQPHRRALSNDFSAGGDERKPSARRTSHSRKDSRGNVERKASATSSHSGVRTKESSHHRERKVERKSSDSSSRRKNDTSPDRERKVERKRSSCSRRGSSRSSTSQRNSRTSTGKAAVEAIRLHQSLGDMDFDTDPQDLLNFIPVEGKMAEDESIRSMGSFIVEKPSSMLSTVPERRVFESQESLSKQGVPLTKQAVSVPTHAKATPILQQDQVLVAAIAAASAAATAANALIAVVSSQVGADDGQQRDPKLAATLREAATASAIVASALATATSSLTPPPSVDQNTNTTRAA